MSREIASVNLTDKQAAFVKHLVAGNSPTEAARLAGYAFPEQDQWRLRATPHVAAAIEQQTLRQLSEMGSLANAAVKRCLAEGAPLVIQLAAAKHVHSQLKADPRDADGKPLNQQSIEQLQASIARMEAIEGIHNAKLIEQPSTPDDLDILEG